MKNQFNNSVTKKKQKNGYIKNGKQETMDETWQREMKPTCVILN